MYRRMLAFLLVLATVLGTSPAAFAAEPPRENELYAKSAVLMDASSGRILYEKNGHAAMANASTTKILTCILALENGVMDAQVEVSANAASQPKVRLGMQAGQKFYLKDLLYGLMLESFNDCAVAIAEHIAGTTEGFADLMNARAEEIGCSDTHFITPNGLDASDAEGFHHTTAADLALLMRYCIRFSGKSQEFLEITRTGEHMFSDVEGKSTYGCYNKNAFLQMMDGALSGKTGFTGTAGYCYVGALERDGRTYIVALLACGWPNNKTYKWSDTRKLMNYGIDNFTKKSLDEVAIDAAKLAPVAVEDGQGEAIGEETAVALDVGEAEGIAEVLVAPGEEVTVRYELAGKLCAPVKKGDYVGKITYLLGDETLREYRVTAADSVEKIDFPWCFLRVLERMWLTGKGSDG